MTASHPSPRRLFSCSSVNPTTHDRPTVTSALNVSYASQSCDTSSVAAVGQRPPAKVTFRLWRPAEAWSVDRSILAGGSLSPAPGRTRLDHVPVPAGSSKSYTTFSPGGSAARDVPPDAT